MTYHTTVLLHEGVNALNVQPNGIYVDATFGGGGHSRLILERLVNGKLFAFDQDHDATRNIPKDDRFILCEGNFRFLKRFLLAHGVDKVDGVIADLGVSGYQFDEADRGFSFRQDAPLDMRMNRNQILDARSVLNDYEEVELKRVFKDFGETSFAALLARRIAQASQKGGIQTTTQLKNIVEAAVPPHKVSSELPKVFQAIRIEVNGEIAALHEFLFQCVEVVAKGGRLVVLSYHSLEDRPVKHFMRSGNFKDEMKRDVYGNLIRPFNPIGKVVEPSIEEIETNPRARSARLRIAERN